MTAIFVASAAVSAAHSGDRSPKSIAVFCALGLVVSFCLIGFGVDLTAGWR